MICKKIIVLSNNKPITHLFPSMAIVEIWQSHAGIVSKKAIDDSGCITIDIRPLQKDNWVIAISQSGLLRAVQINEHAFLIAGELPSAYKNGNIDDLIAWIRQGQPDSAKKSAKKLNLPLTPELWPPA